MATDTLAPEAAPSQETATNAEPSRASTLSGLLAQMNTPAPSEQAEPEPEPVESGPEPTHPEPEPDDADPQEEVRPNSKRIRVNVDHLDPQERRVIELTGKKGLTLAEANRAVYGTPNPQQAAAPQVDPVAEVDAQIAQGEAQIEALEKEIDNVSYDPDAQAALRKQQREITRKLGRLESNKESIAQSQKASVQQQADDAQHESFQRAWTEYPDAYTDDGSGGARFNRATPIGRLAASLDRQFRTEGNAIVNAPDYHEYLLDRASATTGDQPRIQTQPPAAKVTTPVPQAAPKRSVRPVATGGNDPSIQTRAQDIDLAAKSGDKASILAAMARNGTSFTTVRPKGR